MIEKRRRSVLPIYGIAAVWVIWAAFLPMYRLSHFLILAVISAAVWFGLRKLCPDKVEYVDAPERDESTGDEKIDALLKEGKMAVSEMKRLRASIKNEAVCVKIDKLIELTGKIFRDILDDKDDYDQIKRFASYYLPTTIKLLNAYDRMGSQGISGENISGTMSRIEDILDTTVQAYQKQLDALFANQALDIDTDITVLENMLKREGLSGSDFK